MATISPLTLISQQISIYYGIPVLAAGLIGGFLSVIVFLSLKTFRQSSCAFYLTVMSFVNIGQLFSGLLSRIMITGYSTDWTATSPFYCKFRYFLLQLCTLVSLTCITLATIDQYLATSSHPRFQQWSNLKVAYRLTTIFVILWSLHGILYLVFFASGQSLVNGKTSCMIINAIFGKYHTYGYFVILTGFLPISMTVLFALMAFRNIQQLAYRSVPLVRRELEKQLTMIVLVQVAINSFTLLPNCFVYILQANTTIMSDPVVADRIRFASIISLLLYYLNFAVSTINQTI
jgi:hypothetical protein